MKPGILPDCALPVEDWHKNADCSCPPDIAPIICLCGGKPICGRSSEYRSGEPQPCCLSLLPEWTVYADTCHLSLFPCRALLTTDVGKAVTLQSPYRHTLLDLFTLLQRDSSPTVQLLRLYFGEFTGLYILASALNI